MAAEPKAAKAATFTVSAFMVTAKVGQRVVYFNKGDVLPATVAKESLAHLLASGLIAESE